MDLVVRNTVKVRFPRLNGQIDVNCAIKDKG